jgi:septum formation protein
METMYTAIQPLVLASHSPRRKDFLQDLGLEFSIHAVEINETPHADEDPESYVERMAREKARAVSGMFPRNYILAADTAVCLGSTILGKPFDRVEAVSMLMALSGRSHLVRSAICIVCESTCVEEIQSVETEVFFTKFGVNVAEGYVNQAESLDKAGAYAIQGKGAFLVERIVGSYSNVVGLPLAELLTSLSKLGVIRPRIPTAVL